MQTVERSRKAPDLPRVAVALALAERCRMAVTGGLLYLTAGEREAEYLGANLHQLFPQCGVMVLPRWDCLPFDPSGPSREAMGRRASVLRRLATRDSRPPLVIATPEAVLQRVPPRDAWASATLTLRHGEPLSVDELRDFLKHTGYALDALVDEPGEAAIHGRVIDLFPGGALGPVRIELEDGHIATISAYDPISQRAVAELPEVVIDAASELIGATEEPEETPWLSQHYDRLETVFDYMPKALLLGEPRIGERAAAWLEQIEENCKSARALPSGNRSSAPRAESLYLEREEWAAISANADMQFLPEPSIIDVPRFVTCPNPNRLYREFIAGQIATLRRILLTAADARDLKTMTRRAGGAATAVESWQDVLEAAPGSTLAMQIDFDTGFVLHDVAVIAGSDLLGSRTRHVVPMALARDPDALGGDSGLHIGEPVVHLDHGICLLQGIESVGNASTETDTLRLEFAGGSTLMVPVQDISSIWAYGTSAEGVSLDRLNGTAWAKRKADVETEIGEIATVFGAAIKQREGCEAAKLAPPPRTYERFAAGFAYELTPDQAQAIEDVLDDLKSGHPMERLLCGDVGFGKTEVALRAVAAAVLSGKQAAVVVPTTVLARQHLDTFRRRFAAIDVRVELLSRLTTAGETRAVKQGLRDGSVQIVIGTQAIAAKGTHFKDLVLVVIDEEQRFGARMKDQLRGFARGLHLLTMSATPIPRTLQRAIVGLQACSVLETPPARRLPVHTVLKPFEAVLVGEALVNERRRGGQSFIVCPRIEDLEPMAARLREIAPQLHVSLVHGKMPADNIDTAIVAFAAGRGDILLATNIIEAGLDIPRANTILIWRPDRFGAAQLHQLRGRVGRGRRRGFAYLLTDPDTTLPAATSKRLQNLAELNRLGAGFAVSRHDLDLRGAGDLLGETQAGHIKAIGVELYRQLLQQALRGHTAPPAADIRLGIPAMVEADYVPEPEARINLYARISRLREAAGLDDLIDEIEERFGPMPEATANLMAIKRIAETAALRGISEIDAGPDGIAITSTRNLQHHKLHRSGDRYIVRQEIAKDQRIAAVTRLLETSTLKCGEGPSEQFQL